MARSCWSRRRLRQFTLAALLSLAIPVAGFAQAGAPDLTRLSSTGWLLTGCAGRGGLPRRPAVRALGSQIQYDSGSGAGAGVQPTARVIWKGLPHQRLWAAVSRALKTPSLEDQGIRVDLLPQADPGGPPVFVSVVGNPAWTRVGLNAEWRFTPQVSVMVIGQNLLDDAHPEFSGAASLIVATQVRRSAAVRLRWTLP